MIRFGFVKVVAIPTRFRLNPNGRERTNTADFADISKPVPVFQWIYISQKEHIDRAAKNAVDTYPSPMAMTALIDG